MNQTKELSAVEAKLLRQAEAQHKRLKALNGKVAREIEQRVLESYWDHGDGESRYVM